MNDPFAEFVISFDFPPDIGGAHLWLYEVYRRWDSPVDVITRSPSKEREIDDRVADQSSSPLRLHYTSVDGLDLSIFSLDYWRNVLRIHALIKRVSKGRRVRLHCLRAFPEGFVAFTYKCRWLRSTEMVTYSHGEEILIAGTSRQFTLMAKLVYWLSDCVIANSENTQSLVSELQPRAPIAVIHPGVDVGMFRKSQSHCHRLPGLDNRWSEGTIIMLSVGRLEPRKNHLTVVRALKVLRDSGMALAYVCAGGGECADSLLAEVRKLGLEEWVVFPGVVSEQEKISLYKNAHFFIMPSIQSGALIEGFGIVFLEAAAAGLPSICGNSGGQAEAVLDGQTGFVTDGNDQSAVEAAIRKLTLDANVRATMSENCQEWADQHDWASVASRVKRELGRANR